MNVTHSIKKSLIETAQGELNTASKEVERLQDALAKARISQREKEVVLEWAQGLVLGADLMMKPDWDKVMPTPRPFIRKLYYVPSRSGRKYGHYIEVTELGVSCTCPGFVNRLYCHAVREIQAGKNLFKYSWLQSQKEFDRLRDNAMADTRNEQ